MVNNSFIEKCKSIVLENNEDLTIPIFCKKLCLSRSQVHNLITRYCNKSTSIFIRDIRLELSKELLKDPSLTISEIAYKVGFSNPSYFSRMFKEKYFITPKEYKNI